MFLSAIMLIIHQKSKILNLLYKLFQYYSQLLSLSACFIAYLHQLRHVKKTIENEVVKTILRYSKFDSKTSKSCFRVKSYHNKTMIHRIQTIHTIQTTQTYSGRTLKWCMTFVPVIMTSKHFWLLQCI